MKEEEKKAIAIFADNKVIDKIRTEYDKRPIRSHLTLVYPFDSKDNKKILKIKKFVSKLEPFNISFKGFSKSKKEYYLYFDVDENKKKLLDIHKKLYKILSFKFNNPDMPKYIPHISMGIFNSKKEIDKVRKKLESKNPIVNHYVDKISIITLGNSWKPKKVEDIFLKKDKYKKITNQIINLLSEGHMAYWNLPHAQEVLNQLLTLKPKAKEYLKIAALGHDIERSITGETDSKLKSLKKYKDYKKTHALRSAKIIFKILQENKIPKKEIKKIEKIIKEHETGGSKDSNLIREADALAFLNFDVNIYAKENSKERTKEKIQFTYNRLSEKSKKSILQKRYKRKIREIINEVLK